MGWKSTVDITRQETIQLIFSRLANVHQISDRDLGDTLETLGYGDDVNLPYYGRNFFVTDKVESKEDPCDGCHQLGSEYCGSSCKVNK
jgi:hypothetical protein